MKKNKKKRLHLLAERRENRAKRRSAGVVEGKLQLTTSGVGFVTPDEAGEEIFIPASMINHALNGDRVKVELLPEREPRPGVPERSAAGRIVEVLERCRQSFVGELLPGNRIRALDPGCRKTSCFSVPGTARSGANG